jgi:hypothetical protein
MPKDLKTWVQGFVNDNSELADHDVDEKSVGKEISQRLNDILAHEVKRGEGKMAVKILGDKGVRKEVERVIGLAMKEGRTENAKAHKEAASNKEPLSKQHVAALDKAEKALKKEASSWKGVSGSAIHEHLADETSDAAEILYNDELQSALSSKTKGDLYVHLVDERSWAPSEALKGVNDMKFLEEKLGEDIGNWAYEDRDDAASSALDVINSWKRKK